MLVRVLTRCLATATIVLVGSLVAPTLGAAGFESTVPVESTIDPPDSTDASGSAADPGKGLGVAVFIGTMVVMVLWAGLLLRASRRARSRR